MSNQHYFDVPFAFAGDVTAVPDPLQVGGTVSFTEGWNFNYQRNLSTDPAALPIDRSTMNWLLLQITTAIAALQKETVPEWIAAAQNGGVAISYGLGSTVLWSASGNAPFGKYVSVTANNALTPSAGDPLGTTTGWQVVCDPIATSAQAATGTNNASIMTPLLVAQQTALRALLAGSATQVFNVGPATAATHALQQQQKGYVVFTSSGSWTAPFTGTLYVDGCGGGGGGGGGAAPSAGLIATGASGGGAGFPVVKFAIPVTIGDVLTLTIGVAGPGGTSGLNGTAGGTTTIVRSGVTLLTLSGGGGGAVPVVVINTSVGAGPGGGTGSPPGAFGQDTSQYGPGATGGTGGSGPFGGGGPGGRGSTGGATVQGGNGGGNGAGGGGAGGVYGTAGVAATGNVGGNGTGGKLVFQW